MDPLSLFVVCLRASFLSVGGSTALPALRDDLVTRGVLTDHQIVEAIAIGRLSPGPSGLYIVSLGYFALGWLGAAIGLLASTLPPLLLVPAAAAVRRQLLSPWFAGMVRGIALATSGLVIATALSLIAPSGGGAVASWWQVPLLAVGTGIAIERRRHPALAIAVGAALSLLLGR